MPVWVDGKKDNYFFQQFPRVTRFKLLIRSQILLESISLEIDLVCQTIDLIIIFSWVLVLYSPCFFVFISLLIIL